MQELHSLGSVIRALHQSAWPYAPHSHVCTTAAACTHSHWLCIQRQMRCNFQHKAAKFVQTSCQTIVMPMLSVVLQMLDSVEGPVHHLAYERGEDVIVMKGYKFAKAKTAAAATLGCLALADSTVAAYLVQVSPQLYFRLC